MRLLHKMMVLWLVLAYTGQALAGTFLSCPSMAPAATTGSHMAHAMGNGDKPEHAGHHMPAGDMEVSAGAAGCCDDGQCSMSQCQAPPALAMSSLPGSPIQAEARVQRDLHSSPIRPSYSLFKPPISL